MNAEQLFKLLRHYGNISQNAVDAMALKLQQQVISKEEHFIQLHETASRIYFINDKCVRFYRINKSNEEITTDLIAGPAVFTSYTSFCTQTPSNILIQAMDEMIYYSLSYEEFIELCSQYECLLRSSERLIQEAYMRWNKRLNVLLDSYPVERCQWFDRAYSDSKNLVSPHFVASMLGLSTQEYCYLKTQMN